MKATVVDGDSIWSSACNTPVGTLRRSGLRCRLTRGRRYNQLHASKGGRGSKRRRDATVRTLDAKKDLLVLEWRTNWNSDVGMLLHDAITLLDAGTHWLPPP